MDAIEPKYPTDLDDEQWFRIVPLIPPEKPIGCGRKTPMRAVVNALLYRHRTECSWRMLPRDFPHWRTVYDYYRQWVKDGTWDSIHHALRRSAENHAASPFCREPCERRARAEVEASKLVCALGYYEVADGRGGAGARERPM